MFGKKKWYKVAFKAYRKNKMEEPYRTLFRYYMRVGSGTPIANTYSHYEYFTFEKWDGSIANATEKLQMILPEDLFENYLSALEAYTSLGEDPEYEKLMSAFEKQDEYVLWHDEEMINILTDYVNKITAK